jgi:hypothetical protein
MTQPVAPFYVPRPSDDTYWSGAPSKSPIATALINQTMFGAPGQVPTKQWHYDYDVGETFWYATPVASKLIEPELTSAGQVTSRQWLFGDNDYPSYQWKSPNSQIMLPLLAARPKFNAWQWKSTYDNYADSAIWQQPRQGLLLAPFVPPRIKPFSWDLRFTFDDFPAWFQQTYQATGTIFTPPAPLIVPALAFSSDHSAYSAKASDSPSGQNWSGAGYMAKYEIDTSIRLNGEFINAITGVYIDPALVTLYTIDPTGLISIVNYPGAVSKASQGHYFYQLTPIISGTWSYKWQASGTAVATSPDTTFTVNASALIPG